MAVGAGAWWALCGPVVMTLLLMRVSGVPLLEGTIGERRPGYAAYAARTSALRTAFFTSSALLPAGTWIGSGV